MAYLLKARTVEPEKQPLLGNARTQQQRNCHDTRCDAYTAVAMERFSRHVSAETNTGNYRGAVFSVGSVPRVYKTDKEDRLSYSHGEVESHSSTLALQVVGGDEKGSLESEGVKYSHESHGTRTRE
jgi:hypothetical protein